MAKQRGTSKRRAVGHVVACLAALMLVLFAVPSLLPLGGVNADLGATPPASDKAYVAVSSAGEEADADDEAAGEKADDADAPAADALSDADAVADEGAADATAGSQDAKTAEIVARAASAPSAEDMGISYGEAEFERNTVLVEPMEGVTQDQVVAALKAAGADDAVVTDDIDGLLVVDIPGSLAVEDAVAALEYAEVADGAQPNFIYHIADTLETQAVEDGDAKGDADVAADMSDDEAAELPSGLEAVEEEAEAETEQEPVAEQEPSELNVASDSEAVSDEQEAAGESITEDESAAPDTLQTEETTAAEEPTTTDDESAQLETQDTATNDPLLSYQWGLKSAHVYEAWEKVKTEGAVTVAVIDEGFDLTHEDLSDNIVYPYNAAEDAEDEDAVYEVPGQASHGTHVAGIIAAVADNGIGIAGVSYNAKIMPIQVLGATGITSANVVRAYRAICAHPDVKVVNLSLAAPAEYWFSSSEKAANQSRWGDDAIIKEIDAAFARGVVTVAAAGNTPYTTPKSTTYRSPYYAYPSDYEKVIGVINLKEEDDIFAPSLDSSSNYNVTDSHYKNISAPGSAIYSTIEPKNGSDSYDFKTGTSMAAPFVAGVLALIFKADQNLSADEAISRLYGTATDLYSRGWDAKSGYGMVNAAAAVDEKTPYITSEYISTMVQRTIRLTVKGGQEGDSWSWESNNCEVAIVDDEGVVTGVSEGTAVITATSEGKTAVQTISVYNPSIPASSITCAESVFLPITCSLNGSWSWSSSDLHVASVSSSGVVTGRGVGKAEITATLTSNPSVSTSAEVTATAASLDNATVSVFPSSATYTGKELKPSYLRVSLNGVTLTAGTDYTVQYSDNVNVGTATVTVTGVPPNYEGAKGATFSIVAPASSSSSVVTKSTSSSSSTTTTKSTTKSTVSATVAKTSIAKATISGLEDKVYTGSALTQTPVVKLGATTLRANTDYTVSYANNKNAGTATVTVTGKGNYEGTASATFTIVGKPAFTAGATKMPIGSTSVWKLENCSLKVTSGKGVLTIKDTVVTAKKAGTAKVAVVNGLGQTIATKTVKVYKLSGKHALQSAAKSSLYLDVKDASKKNGGNIIAWSKTGKANQKFTFTLKNGYYTLKAANSGKLVTVAKGSKKAGANVYQWASKNATYQRWKITVDSKNRLTFINVKSGKALGCKGNSAKKGVSVMQLKPAEKLAQKWVVK